PSPLRATFIPPDSIAIHERPNELAYLAPAVDKGAKWEPGQLFKFVNAMSETHLLPVGTALEIGDFAEKNKPLKVEAVHREILWQSSSIFTYAFRSLEQINYHDLVVWCSGKLNIPKNEARFTSTFDLERQMVERQ